MAYLIPEGGPVRLRTSIVSGEVPVAAEMTEGELALNSADGRVFFKSPSGSVQSTEDVPTVVNLGTTEDEIDTDCSLGAIFDVTITDDATLEAPANPANGMTIRWRVTQGTSGNHGVTLNGIFNIPSSATSPLPWSTAEGDMDILAATYHAGRDKWDVVAFVPGY